MEAILIQLSEIFSHLLAQPGLALRADMRTGDLEGWDSFKNVEILMECEARWSLRFSSREIDRMRTAGDLASCIAAKLAAAN